MNVSKWVSNFFFVGISVFFFVFASSSIFRVFFFWMFSAKNPFRVIGTEPTNLSMSTEQQQQKQHTFISTPLSNNLIGSDNTESIQIQSTTPRTNASMCFFRNSPKQWHLSKQPIQQEPRETSTHKILINQTSAPSYFTPIDSYTVKKTFLRSFLMQSYSNNAFHFMHYSLFSSVHFLF